MSQFAIKCDGEMFNSCGGMTETEARRAFEMYSSGQQVSKGHRFELCRDGVVIDAQDTRK